MCIRDRFKFCEQLVSSGELICVIVQNLSKIGQTVLEISQVLDFENDRRRRPPSWILKCLNFWSTVRLGGLICIAVPNFTKTSQTVAEISHLNFSKWRSSAIWDFFKFDFLKLVSSGRLICGIVQNFIKIGQTVLEISRFFWFSRWPPSAILNFEIFKFFVDCHIGRPNIHRRTKFHQNRSNANLDF